MADKTGSLTYFSFVISGLGRSWLNSRRANNIRKHLVRLSAHEFLIIDDHSRHSRDAIVTSLFPIRINRILKRTLSEDSASIIGWKSRCLSNVHDDFNIADVAAIDEVCPVERIGYYFKTR